MVGEDNVLEQEIGVYFMHKILQVAASITREHHYVDLPFLAILIVTSYRNKTGFSFFKIIYLLKYTINKNKNFVGPRNNYNNDKIKFICNGYSNLFPKDYFVPRHAVYIVLHFGIYVGQTLLSATFLQYL
jgi:hypothetical protein